MNAFGFVLAIGGVWLIYHALQELQGSASSSVQAAPAPSGGSGGSGASPPAAAAPGAGAGSVVPPPASNPQPAGGSNPNPPSGQLSAKDLAAGLLNQGFTAAQATNLVAVLLQENNGVTNSGCNSSNACGFAQIVHGLWDTGQGAVISAGQLLGTAPADIAAQFAAVRSIYNVQGIGAWDPWSYVVQGGREVFVGAGQGNYTQRLGEAQQAVAAVQQGYCSPWGAFASVNCGGGA